MPYNNEELRQRIRGKYPRIADFAKELGITNGTLSAKLAGKRDWKGEEMVKAAELLDLTSDDIHSIFFGV